jgi:hypothetical protein
MVPMNHAYSDRTGHSGHPLMGVCPVRPGSGRSYGPDICGQISGLSGLSGLAEECS